MTAQNEPVDSPETVEQDQALEIVKPTVDLDAANAQAEQIIKRQVKWAAAAAIVPIPLLDLAALATVQVKMIKNIAQCYGADASESSLKPLVASLLGTLGAAGISGGLLGSSAKVVPVTGTILGSIGFAAFGSAATYALGRVFASHFASGGTLENFSASAASSRLKAEYQKARTE
ncbi:YcjF family protein [Neopusillimonas aromaticivorans]|jgi:uncharacterized protein (DUF697 family)|uniref:YcjF family protein n=1 Tax=Neopusillimonas aromaticivorans TaxID=2979868 RepID=UPI00259A19D0|nr:DUF697 domain-containing protein [Neopusillimonas aromaticivorans]WJJ92669.1 DUF697 domain-containing protein [Neopusillimonas aromaticivorans]